MSDLDARIAEVAQAQKDRTIIVVAAVIGIIASAALGLAFTLGGLGNAASGASGARNPASLIFFVGPFAVCMAIGYLVHAIVRRRR
jgi:hypothetical protein